METDVLHLFTDHRPSGLGASRNKEHKRGLLFNAFWKSERNIYYGEIRK
jgi:hypothetical protein